LFRSRRQCRSRPLEHLNVAAIASERWR
jgi:hypothetical protein